MTASACDFVNSPSRTIMSSIRDFMTGAEMSRSPTNTPSRFSRFSDVQARRSWPPSGVVLIPMTYVPLGTGPSILAVRQHLGDFADARRGTPHPSQTAQLNRGQEKSESDDPRPFREIAADVEHSEVGE
jgi:hypothetical protein